MARFVYICRVCIQARVQHNNYFVCIGDDMCMQGNIKHRMIWMNYLKNIYILFIYIYIYFLNIIKIIVKRKHKQIRFNSEYTSMYVNILRTSVI